MHNVQPPSHTPTQKYWCSYQPGYTDIYESSYQANIIFYDEDEFDDYDNNEFDSFTPLLPGGLADR